MGSGDDQRLAAHQELFVQQGGHGGEGNALVQHALDLGVAARERIADHHQVWRGIEIGFGERLKDGDAQAAQQIAHGRIGFFVRARDAVAL